MAKPPPSHTNSSEYRIWSGLKQRCLNPNSPAYKDYGARGIRVCDEWKDNFLAFFSHVGKRPSRNHSIDRKNNDGHYEPGNVRWATRAVQAANRRNSLSRIRPGPKASPLVLPLGPPTSIMVSTPASLLHDIDLWRSLHSESPSRPQSIRYLTRIGLKYEMGRK